MTDPAALYRDLMLCLPERYTAADMARDFKATFGTDQGQRVLAQIWVYAGGMTAHEGYSDQALRAIEGKRAVANFILVTATAEAQSDGTAVTVFQKMQMQPPEVGDA